MPAVSSVVSRNIRKVLARKARELVAAYYDPNGPFAGALFDNFGDNHPSKFTSDDLVAAGLLDVRFGPQAVRGLLNPATSEIQQQLKKISPKARLWQGYDLSSADALWSSLVNLDGVGPTKASKLLSRKRPHLIPIVDSVIRNSLAIGRANSWVVLSEVLADGDLRASIDALAPSGQSPSTLRLLDVAVWMRFSESTNARAVRAELGLPVSDRVVKTP